MDTIAQSIPLVFIVRAGVAELAHFPDLPVRSQRQPDHGMRGAQAGTSRQPMLWPAACHR